MNAIKDIQLKGNNLCNVECQDKNGIVHPETCVDQVLTTHTGSVTLSDWLTYSGTETPLDGFDSYNGLIPWLQHYYPISGYTLPEATDTTLGGITVGGNLSIDNGELSVDVASLHIPSEVETTSYTTEGKIALGNDTKLPSNFVNNPITDTGSNIYPLRLDANNHAGIAIPQSDFSAQVQVDWNQGNLLAVDYIKNKPTIPTVYNSTVTFKQGNITKGAVTLNQSSSATINLDAVEIATSSTLGGIKIGYTKEGNKKPVQLDENNKAFVDTEPHPIVGGMITNGLSAHFFRVGTGMESGSFTAGKWIPILTSDTMTTSNIGKCSVCFEIFMRENSKTGYAKYYLNHMSGGSLVTNKILCLSFYSEDPDIFDYDDIRCARYVDSEDNEKVKLTIYKKVRNVTHSMFVVNILSENSDTYSTQHYFYTGTSSIGETGYQLLSNDLRIGAYSTDTQKMTACLTNESGDTPIEMDTIGADNATSYTTI